MERDGDGGGDGDGDGSGRKESPPVNEGEGGEKKNYGEGDAGPSSRINERIAGGYDQDSVVYWESLLDQRSLHVLLVENDDSARLIVAVLLRKCGYQVTVAANGLQAWKILKDLSNHIDLVLSEVDIPCLSGIGLLCNIMNHNIRKNIPVVMMSFTDSISLVFKCLSKGAVDYLLKPVRKNELKNLWQHIWRRWRSSCGSESEIGAQAQKTVKLREVEIFGDNSTGSNDEDDSASFGLNLEGGSDNASGTQSSWTKPVVEVSSSQTVSPMDHLAEHPDSTCAIAIRSNSEVVGPGRMPTAVTRECQAHEKQLGNAVIGKDLETGVTKTLDLQLESPVEVPINIGSTKQNILSKTELNRYSKKRAKAQCQSPCSSSKDKTVKLMRLITDTSDACPNSREFQAPNKTLKILESNKAVDVTKEEKPRHLGLKRLRDVEDITTTVQDDHNLLRHLGLSVISRCNAASNAHKDPSMKKRSRSSQDYSSEAVLKDKSAPTSTDKGLHSCAAFPSMENNLLCTHQALILDKVDDKTVKETLDQPRATNQDFQVQHLDPCHHYHHLVQNIQQKLLPNQEDLSLKKVTTAAPQHGSSNILGVPVGGHAGSVLDGSTSTYNKEGIRSNLRKAAINAGEKRQGSDIGMAGESGNVGSTDSGSNATKTVLHQEKQP